LAKGGTSLFAFLDGNGGGFFVDGNALRITDKELFYSAMMLNLDRLVNVEYVFPADEAKLSKELDEVKRSLHKKKLLKENAKGEITLDFALSACAAYCAKPDHCTVVDEEGYYATIYGAANSYMLLERTGDGECAAVWFRDREALDEYVTRKLGDAKGKEKEEEANGGA
jgi:hypothetical protein